MDVLRSYTDEKSKKFFEAYLEKHIVFTPFVDGMIAQENTIFLKRTTDRLLSKWETLCHNYELCQEITLFCHPERINICKRRTRCLK